MKNQYFGDINDIKKYSVLQGLAGTYLTLSVCMMLTKGDGGPDGKKTNYLDSPDKWRHRNPELFDTFYEFVKVRQNRKLDTKSYLS
jgi:hypothetical protein